MTKDDTYLNLMVPYCQNVMKKSIAWDTDGDGLIENSGSADQTYDTWIMKGASAYCGGLWLASLHAMVRMLKACNSEDAQKWNDIEMYQDMLTRGAKSYDSKLWTGEYYKFDCSG